MERVPAATEEADDPVEATLAASGNRRRRLLADRRRAAIDPKLTLRGVTSACVFLRPAWR